MSLSKTKPAYDSAKRIKALTIGVVICVVMAVAAWFGVAHWIGQSSQSYAAQLSAQGQSVACVGQSVRGFPFRFGLFCDRLSYSNLAESIEIEAGAVRSAAQFYDLRDIIVELDAPLRMQRGGVEWLAAWKGARLSALVTEPVLRRAALDIRAFDLKIEAAPVLRSETVGVYWRAPQTETEQGSAAGDLDLAARFDGISRIGPVVMGGDMPTLGLDVDLVLHGFAEDLANKTQSFPPSTGFEGELRRLAISLTPDSGLLVSGPLRVGGNGLLSGDFEVRIVDVDHVASVFGAVDPSFQAMADIVLALPRAGTDNDESTFQISVKDGQVQFGFIPLASLPALF